MRLLREFAAWILDTRKWWLVPIVAALILVAAVLLVASLGPLSPFLYPFF